MTEQQQIEYHEILKSYEDTINNLGEDVSTKTIDRYCELVMKEYPTMEKRQSFLKSRLDENQIKIINRDDWTSIKDTVRQKVEALYKVYLSENIDDIRAKLEQIGDQIKSYKAVLPNYIRNIIKNISEGKNVSNPDRLSGDLHLRSMHQALQDLQGVGRRNMFGIFLFAITV